MAKVTLMQENRQDFGDLYAEREEKMNIFEQASHRQRIRIAYVSHTYGYAVEK